MEIIKQGRAEAVVMRKLLGNHKGERRRPGR